MRASAIPQIRTYACGHDGVQPKHAYERESEEGGGGVEGECVGVWGRGFKGGVEDAWVVGGGV
jgi:hypothetical protein